jgi:hypothetical protein
MINVTALTVQRPVFSYVNTGWKICLEVNFMYLCKEETYCFCKTCHIISVLFDTKCCLFHNFVFFCSNNTFFIKYTLKFKYPPHCGNSWRTELARVPGTDVTFLQVVDQACIMQQQDLQVLPNFLLV